MFQQSHSGTLKTGNMVYISAKNISIPCFCTFYSNANLYAYGDIPGTVQLSSSVYTIFCVVHMSRARRKPFFCLCENKGTDQLRGNCEADQCLCFATWTVQFLFYLHFKHLAFFCDCTALFVLDLVGNPNCCFPHAQAHMLLGTYQVLCSCTIFCIVHMSRDARKPVFRVSNKVRHKPACLVTEKG